MKFFVGDEHTGLRQDKVEWVQRTFHADSYRFVDEGYFHYERHVVFEREEDAALYRMRWS